MRIRPFVLPVLAATLMLAGPLLGYQAAVHDPSSAFRAHHVYRLDYTVSVAEPGKAAVTSAYVLNVEEGGSADVHAGENIPLTNGSSGQPSMRQDVGVLIHGHLARAGGDLVLHSGVELSAPEERADPGPRALRKVSANDDAVVTPGQAALVASLVEPVSHARYEVMVTAQRLR